MDSLPGPDALLGSLQIRAQCIQFEAPLGREGFCLRGEHLRVRSDELARRVVMSRAVAELRGIRAHLRAESPPKRNRSQRFSMESRLMFASVALQLYCLHD